MIIMDTECNSKDKNESPSKEIRDIAEKDKRLDEYKENKKHNKKKHDSRDRSKKQDASSGKDSKRPKKIVDESNGLSDERKAKKSSDSSNKRDTERKTKNDVTKAGVDDVKKRDTSQRERNTGRYERPYRNFTYEDRRKGRADENDRKRKHNDNDLRKNRETFDTKNSTSYPLSSRDKWEKHRLKGQTSHNDRDQSRNINRKDNLPAKGSRAGTNNEELSSDKTKAAEQQKKEEMKHKKSETIGAYIPPGKLKLMQSSITDKTSVAYQRISWEALKKSIHGLINKVNTSNIGVIVRSLLKENIIRGKGLLCRSLIQAQTASPTFTRVYAAVAAVINSKFPSIGELLLQRCIIQFKRSFQNKKKDSCISSATFIAHFVNQRMAHEIIALEILTLLIENATDDSIEVAIAFLKECGQKLTEVSSRGVNAIFDMLRNILHEGNLEKRVQYMIEVMFQIRKDGFKDYPSLIDELDLVEEEDQITHLITLTDKADPQNMLNVFKHDAEFELNEERYQNLKMEILGNDEDDDDEGEDADESGDDEDDEEQNEKQDGAVVDRTETDLISFRRVVYLTINSSLDFEECAHKLLKMQVKPGQEKELCHMFLDCCAEQRTYEKFFGLLAQRFCQLNKIYVEPLHEIFRDSYCTIHRLDTNRLRNVAKFFGHLLMTDAISWEVLKIIHLNEEETTSSSRIFIKILFQQLSEYMGMEKLNQRIIDPALQSAFEGLFPRDNPKNTRFSINFFTSIGLGGLTDNLREHLKAQPKESTRVPAKLEIMKLEEIFSSSSSSLSSLTSSSSDTSEDERVKKKKRKKKSKTKAKTSKKQKKHSR